MKITKDNKKHLNISKANIDWDKFNREVLGLPADEMPNKNPEPVDPEVQRCIDLGIPF